MDALERLVANAETLLKEGYYDVRGETDRSPSFLDALGAPTRTSDVVAELKFASPSMRSQNDVAQFDAILEGIAAAMCGASALLLIETLARRGHLHRRMSMLIDEAHDRKVGVVLEVHTLEEWDAAVETPADILGINNRNLATISIDLGTPP